MPLRIAALALMATLVLIPEVTAQPFRLSRDSSLWGRVTVPGGVAAAREVFGLGTAQTRPDEAWLLDFARRYHAVGNSDVGDVADRYFRFLTALQAESRNWLPAGCGLPTSATPPAERDRIRRFIQLLGFRLLDDRGIYTVEFDRTDAAQERRGWLAAVGVDTAMALAELGAGRRVAIDISDDQLPLPIPGYWADRDSGDDRPLIVKIASNRARSYLYYGLFSLDDETLAFLGGHPELVRRLETDVAGAFATFGRSLHIRDGVVVPPGGDAAVSVWRRLVGGSPVQADVFIRQLLRRSDGRLAYFYDAVAHLDPARQAFVLGNHLPEPERGPFVQRVFDRFARFEPRWALPQQPFTLREFDPATALAFVAVHAGGVVGPGWWPSLLGRVTDRDGWTDRPAQTLQALGDEPADAAWFVSWLFDTPGEARQRFDLLRFLQRQFSGAPRDEAPAIELALRTFHDMPALALALERMKVDEATLIARVGRAAHELTEAGGRTEAVLALARWQAALGWLEQIHRHRVLPDDVLTRLLVSLSDITPSRVDNVPAATTAWIVEQLLPTVLGTEPQPGPEEPEFDWLVGLLTEPDTPPAPPLIWEGLPYQIDRTAPARSAARVRNASIGPRLQDLVALHAVLRQLESPLSSVEDVASVASALEGLDTAVSRLPTTNDRPHDGVRWWRDAVERLRGIDEPGDVDRAARELDRVRDLTDAFADVVLPSVLYALAVAPTNQPAQLFSDSWSRHQLATENPTSWKRVAWEPPATQVYETGGTYLRGALLTLDVALADSQLRPVTADQLFPPPTLHAMDHRTLVESLVLRSNADLADNVQRDIVTTALADGRATVVGWGDAPPDRQSLRSTLGGAGVDEWRVNLALWFRDERPDSLSRMLSVTEIYWIGGGRDLPAAWGVSSRGRDGCLCFAGFDPQSATWFLGRAGSGLNGSVQTDLPLRVAELLGARALPAELMPLVLPSAVRDWTDRAWQFIPLDGDALANFPTTLTWPRVEEYILALIAAGVLVSPDGRLEDRRQ